MILTGLRRTVSTAAITLTFSAIGCGRDPAAAARAFVQSGDTYVAHGKLKDAVIEYRNALDLQPNAAGVHYKLALTYERLREPEKAYNTFARVAQLDETNIDAALRVAGMLAAIGEYQRATTIAERVVAWEPRNVRALATLARALSEQGQSVAAARRLDEALAIDPKSPHALIVRATWESRDRQVDRARRTLQQAIEADPDSTDAHLMLGRLEWTARDPGAAEAALQRALAVSPYPVLVHRVLVSFYLDTGRAAAAEPHLRAAAEASGRDRLALADYFVNTGRIDDAAAELTRLVNDRSLRGEVQLRRAVVAHAKGQAAVAHAELDEALRDPVAESRARLLKSEWLLGAGDLDGARTHVERAVELEPRSPEATYLAGLVQLARGDMVEAERFLKRARTLARNPTAVDIELARIALHKGDVVAALRLSRELANARPTPRTHALLSRALREAGNLRGAEQVIATARRKWPDAAIVEVEAAHLELRAGRVKTARVAYERALQLEPGMREPRRGLVLAQVASGELDEARVSLERWQSDRAHDSQPLLLSAALDVSEGKHSSAEHTLRRALRAAPHDLAIVEALARLYAVMGNTPEAMKYYESVAARRTRPVEALTMIGILKEQSGDRAGAQEAYGRALELDTGAGIAANNLAWLHAVNGSLDEALRLAKSAAAALQQAPEALDTLGWVYHLKGDAASAIRALETARVKAPTNPVYAYHFGVACLKAGRVSEARTALSAALRMSASFEGADEARRVLASLP